MFTLTFRTKVQRPTYADGTPARPYVTLPSPERRHVDDMHNARMSRKYGPYANSDLFPGMLRRIVASVAKPVGETSFRLHLDEPLPPGVTVDTGGFLAVVSIAVND